jgi:hypothetical protein
MPFACVGIWIPSAESRLLLLHVISAKIIAQTRVFMANISACKGQGSSRLRCAYANDHRFIGRHQNSFPIGLAPYKPHSSIPRFPPSRFIQRLPAGIITPSSPVALRADIEQT